ncbi:hypothetical protein FD30_GL001444 [Levilactobacillus namurensis DSM 19117]|uniref:HTH tetR-type domain-containing protein n=1 Tax=Levilactobacillus namurensis DSM 19117 TaxID=1423773 RepID=A0A0R1JYW0_9LACO|nr:TetR/AcrR family transcriptional regulator [Levilactobacillus namurensis]KRK76272.1 hypothetical protein FD30_GL001444 [Levilactobacillus namurensis DSM 19117]GEO73707.1 TetR family transcriptional regulator [Levilactobacillus namurensis]
MTKAQAQIIHVFLKLLAQKPLPKITVAAITRTAHLNRGTFYLYYRDVYDLYDHITHELLQHLAELVDETYPTQPGPQAFLALAQAVINYLNSQHAMLQILLQDGNSDHFIEQIRELFIQKVMAKEHIPLTNHPYHIDVIYNINGVIGVIIDWQRGRLHCSQDVVIQRLAHILAVL